MSVNNENDLRTDACPSPPRNDDEKPFTNNHDDETRENVNHKTTSSSKSRTKRVKPKASNVVTMVNINNSSKVHVGDFYNYNANPVQSETVPAKIIRSEAINNLLVSSEAVEEQHLDFVSGHLTVDGWMKVAQSLNFSSGQIQQLQKRCEARGIREVVYNMLVEWKQKEPKIATLGNLGTVLWDNKEEEAVSRLANKFFST